MLKPLVIVGALLGCITVSMGWAQDLSKRIENEYFLFYIPSDMHQLDGQGIDSFVQRFESDNMQLSFDYGRHSNNFNGWPEDTTYKEVIISGEPARIGTATYEFREGFPYSTQVHFRLDGRVLLSMFAAYKTESDVAIAHAIFDTIIFKE